jgi:signal transduction histidine kinase/ActR/RegA family two-component response regulator
MAVPLRRRLFVLIAAGVLPLAVMAGLSLAALWRQSTRQSQQVGIELARSVANAVDAELRSTIATLSTLGTTLTLDRGDLAGFRTRADLVVTDRPEWFGIQLLDRSGKLLVDTRTIEGAPLPVLAEPESFARLVRSRQPEVGYLTRHGADWLFAVRTPVVRSGSMRYVLTALVRPEAIRDVLTRQNVPPGWVISILDAHDIRVARSRAHEENLGGRLSDSAQQVVNQGGNEGSGIAFALEGQRIFTPYSRIQTGNWKAVFGIPTQQLDATVYRSLAAYGSGVVLSLALGTLGAIWVARSITRPISGLRRAAESLARKQVPHPLETEIEEIKDVGAALRAAGEELAGVEGEREALLTKEREARETAEAADRAKDEFMAVLSHELRTPLNAVYGWARMLQSGQLRDESTIARAKDAIVRNADAQVQLIDDLLDLSRITSGKMRLDVRRVDLAHVLQGALDTVRPASDAKSIAIRTAIDPGLGAVTGDPARLQQVVWNLLMNAVKFTPRGGEVEVLAERDGASVQITVRDTGKGITPEMLPHIFERFRQADSSSTRSYGGLGLGLALVKHLVELHGGTVSAESAGDGQGATFTVALPVAQAPVPAGLLPAPHGAAVSVEVAANITRLDHLRVLVVDDDGEGLALAEAILTRAGAEVRTSGSAADALEVLQQWRPDVLVSDVEMPGEDGYSLIRKVRELEAGKANMPAIALSGYGRPQDRLRALAAGFNMHVPKPVDPRELTTIVAGLAGQTTQEPV